MDIIRSIPIFILAGVCEIGGGYLIWLCLKEDKPWWFGVFGGFLLAFYGVSVTWQTFQFGRVYAAYVVIFILLSVLCVNQFDHFNADKYDIIVALIVLLGVCIIYYAPRA